MSVIIGGLLGIALLVLFAGTGSGHHARINWRRMEQIWQALVLEILLPIFMLVVLIHIL